MRILACRRARLLALGAALVGASRLLAQDTPSPASPRVGRILGVFDENGRPVDGVEIVDRINGGSLRTTQSGLIGMAGVASQHDSAVVTIRKIGFADTTVLVMVGTRDTVPMQVFLRRASAIEEVVITARETEHLPFYLKDFEERYLSAKVTGAKTFTPAELRKVDGLRLYDLLFTKHVGVRSPRCGKIVVYLDGVLWTPPDVEPGSAGVPREDADHFDAAVFYSLSEMPAEIARSVLPTLDTDNGLNPTMPCGALLLYSRRRI